MNKTRDKKGRFARVPEKPAPFEPTPVTGFASPLELKNNKFVGQVVVPHHLTYAQIWQLASKSYLTLDDEAKRNHYANALAMRRDASIMKSLRARQIPVSQLPFVIEVEDPDDGRQKQVARELTAIVNAIPRFTTMKLNLSEANWYGKAGVQTTWGWKKILGKQFLTIVDHFPINGDKITYQWDGTPGILVYRPFQPSDADIEMTNWGPALFLYDEFYRDRFIIHRYEPDDTDYLFESELAGAVNGVGLRSRLYWVYQVRHEVLGWIIDALQRIGTNGMLVGYYPTGNEKAQEAVAKALEDLIAKSVTTFPVDHGHEQDNRIDAIPPATVAYDVLINVLKYFDSIIEVMILGQPLSSGTASTGMGSDVADLHATTLEKLIRYDAINLSETLTTDLLGPIIKYNYGDLDFNVKLKLVSERVDTKDLAVTVKALWDMGVPMDSEELREKFGLSAPRSEETTVVNDAAGETDFRVGDSDKGGDSTAHTNISNYESQEGDN